MRRGLGTVLAVAVGAGTVAAVADPAAAGVSPYHRFAGAVVGGATVPDGAAGCAGPGAAREVSFPVSGVPTGSQLTGVRITGLMLSHPRVSDLTVSLVAPGGAEHVLFSRTGVSLDDPDGYDARLTGPYAFSDDRSTEWWTWASGAEVPAGRYFPTAPGDRSRADPVRTGLTAAFAGLADPNGVWRLRVADHCQGPPGALGEVGAATLELKTAVDDMFGCVAEGMRSASARTDLAAADAPLGAARTALTATAAQQGAADAARQSAAVGEGSSTASASAAEHALGAARQAVIKATAALAQATKQAKKAKKAGPPKAVAKARAKVKRARRSLQAARAKEQSAAEAAYDAARSGWQDARDRLEQARQAEVYCLDS